MNTKYKQIVNKLQSWGKNTLCKSQSDKDILLETPFCYSLCCDLLHCCTNTDDINSV